jgi:hypothetical protein
LYKGDQTLMRSEAFLYDFPLQAAFLGWTIVEYIENMWTLLACQTVRRASIGKGAVGIVSLIGHC